MRAEKNVPEIRFNGFSGAWLQSNLAECTDLLTGNPFNSKEFTTSGFLLVRGMNVKRGYLDTSANLSEYWPSSKGLERYLLEPEDIVIQMDGALIGKSYAKIISKNLPAILVQRVTRIRCSKVNPDLIYQYIQKDFLNHISGIKTETAVPHLSLHDIRNFPVFLPENLEQTAIGNTFQKLDKLINQHQQKQNKLSNIKKAMLEKMFPKQGETIPEIRFKGFSGAWEVMTLGDYTTFRRGSFPQPYGNKEWYGGEGSMPFVQVVDVSKELSLVEETKQKISLKAQPRSVFVSKGSVVVTLQGTIGRVAVTQYDSFVDRTILIFESFSRKTDSSFWAYTIQNKFDLEKKRAPGGTIKTITKDALSSFDVLIPSTEEQTAIGNTFQKLDALINQHQQQITKLNNIKQACLSKCLFSREHNHDHL